MLAAVIARRERLSQDTGYFVFLMVNYVVLHLIDPGNRDLLSGFVESPFYFFHRGHLAHSFFERAGLDLSANPESPLVAICTARRQLKWRGDYVKRGRSDICGVRAAFSRIGSNKAVLNPLVVQARTVNESALSL